VIAERERVLAEARAQARAIVDHANQGADSAFENGRQRVRRNTTGWSQTPGPRLRRRVDEPVTSS